MDYDPQQRRLLTESYMARRATVELEGLDTTISLTEMKHRVAGMPQAYNVRGRMAAQGEPLAPLPMAGGGGGVGAEGSMEARALAAGTLQRFEILPRREWVEGSDEDHHFRIAEAQFLRTGGGHRVQMVEYVVNPPLLAAFEEKQREFMGRHGPEGVKTILSFHGTKTVAAIDNILLNNFDMGRNARGRYGAGLYFSEKAQVAAGYDRCKQVLLCKLLIGKEYRIQGAQPSGPHPGENAPLVAVRLCPCFA